jgi:hypothetical protein
MMFRHAFIPLVIEDAGTDSLSIRQFACCPLNRQIF